MTSELQYVPVLKAKQGEFAALQRLDAEVKKRLTPLLEAPPLEGYGDLEPPGEPEVDTMLRRLPAKIERAWGQEARFFLDLGLVDSDPALAAGEQPATFVLTELLNQGLRAVPVTALSREAAYQDAIGEAAASAGSGVCLRLGGDDLEDPPAAVTAALDLLGHFGLGGDDADVVVDLGELTAALGPSVLVVDVTMRALAEASSWRTITVAATGFPNVSDYGANSINMAQRYEWDLWRRVRARELPIAPNFGDYGIFGTQTVAAGGAFSFAPSPNLRYTTGDDWLIFKARSAIRYGYEQFNDICRVLVDRPEYAGAGFSWADGYIERCAQGGDGPGNASTWIQVGTNHHITAVVHHLANLDET